MIRGAVRWLDERAGTSPVARRALRYVFPDHWSFSLGEIALVCFAVLLLTGVYLTFFFEPSTAQVVYDGEYEPLRGATVSEAYASTVDISLEVTAGLLMRQTHHWAALAFVAVITLHLLRIFFTGAFRKPRQLNYYVGLLLLTLALAEGFAGYSLPDDLLSGMGLAIAWSTALSVPVVGAWLGLLVWGGEFPGASVFEPRLYIAHVLILPAVIATLMALHIWLVTRPRHTDFPGPGRTERNVVGSPAWPGHALRQGGLSLVVVGVLFLLGGLVQINPVWQYGPYEPWLGTNGAQPDWYLGWLIGALRITPAWELHLFGWTIAPNPFFGGILFPAAVFGVLFAWPTIERLITRDTAPHNLLNRPRDVPWRTATGVALVSWVAIVFLAGASDRLWVEMGFPYEGQVWFFRVASILGPVVLFWITLRVCRELRDSGRHPLRGAPAVRVRRRPDGGFAEEPLGLDDDTHGGGAGPVARPRPAPGGTGDEGAVG